MVREGGGGDAAPTPCFPWSVGEPPEREAGRLAFGGIVERDLSGAISDGGTPYLRAFDFLVRAREDGADVLTTIFRADLERGPAYVRKVFRAERAAAAVSPLRGVAAGMRGWLPHIPQDAMVPGGWPPVLV